MRNVKIDTSNLEVLAVPDGFKIKYKHHYKVIGKSAIADKDGKYKEVFTKRLIGSEAWLENMENGEVVAHGASMVSKKDTPNKKLGRIMAHNRCIKHWNELVEQARGQR